jgi:hypothetical protein
MRKLIHVPVVHTVQDLGGLGSEVRKNSVQKHGAESWNRKILAVANYWGRIEKQIQNMKLDWKKVRIYQDGLPLCDRELDIVRDVADQGSRNHRLILHLVDNGATLMGTESAELLMREYSSLQENIHSQEFPGEEEGSAALLTARDRYIAQRINSTLLPGETGLVFLGLLHNVKPFLDRDITVRLISSYETRS